MPVPTVSTRLGLTCHSPLPPQDIPTEVYAGQAPTIEVARRRGIRRNQRYKRKAELVTHGAETLPLEEKV